MNTKHFKNYINKILSKIGILHLFKFPDKVSDNYLDNYKIIDNNNLFIKIYNKIQRTKMYIWSHVLSCIGWYFLFYSLQTASTEEYTKICIITLSSFFLICFIEEIFYPNFRIKWEFIYENRFYHIIWSTGIVMIFVSFLI